MRKKNSVDNFRLSVKIGSNTKQVIKLRDFSKIRKALTNLDARMNSSKKFNLKQI